MDIFNIILYKPLFNALILLYNFIPGHDFGIAIIFLTIIIKTLLAPLSLKAVKSQKDLQEIQPKIKELQTKYKNDKERQAKELLEIYKSKKINLVLISQQYLEKKYLYYRGLKQIHIN